MLDFLSPITNFFRPEPAVLKETDFNIMREEASKNKTEVIELFDFSQEARQEKIRAQLDDVAKILIPTTYSITGLNGKPLEDRTYTYYQFFLAMGDIQLIEHKTPPSSCTSYFIVESENQSWRNARGHCWNTRSRIVGVTLNILVENERENSIAQELFVKARAVLA